MRNVPDGFAHRANLCHVWLLYLNNGVRLGFTDHDRTLLFKQTHCHPNTGFTPADIDSELGFSSQTGALEGRFDSEHIIVADLEAGIYNNARLEAYRVDWSQPSDFVHLHTGLLGQIKRQGDVFEAEWRGLASELEASTGRVFSRLCDAAFGDVRCGIDTAQFPEGTECPKTLQACQTQFSNVLNFRGFPYLIGDDALIGAPDDTDIRDGGSRYGN